MSGLKSVKEIVNEKITQIVKGRKSSNLFFLKKKKITLSPI